MNASNSSTIWLFDEFKSPPSQVWTIDAVLLSSWTKNILGFLYIWKLFFSPSRGWFSLRVVDSHPLSAIKKPSENCSYAVKLQYSSIFFLLFQLRVVPNSILLRDTKWHCETCSCPHFIPALPRITNAGRTHSWSLWFFNGDLLCY